MSEVSAAPVDAQAPAVAPASQVSIAQEPTPAQEPSQTIFARNLPPNLNELEFTMLFQNQPGYITGRVKKNKEGAPIGFVEFDSIEHSIAAKNAVALDQAGTDLVLEFSHTPRSRQTRQPPFMHYPRGHKREFRDMPLMPPHMGAMPPPAMPPQVASSSTLFVSNVPPDATPREMSHIFRNEPGFRCVRFVPHIIKTERFYSQHQGFLCFVEFDTPMDAGRALNNLQSYIMDLSTPSSPQLMITFARTQRKARHM